MVVILCVSYGRAMTASRQASSLQVTALIAQADKASLALQFQEAVARIDEAIAAAQKTGDLIGLASAYMAATDYAKAIPALEAAIAKKPEASLLAYRQNSLCSRRRRILGLLVADRSETGAPWMCEKRNWPVPPSCGTGQ